MAHKYVKRYDTDYIEKRFLRSEKYRPYSSFAIQFNLLHPQPSMMLLNLLSFQFCFVVFLKLKIISFVRHEKGSTFAQAKRKTKEKKLFLIKE